MKKQTSTLKSNLKSDVWIPKRGVVKTTRYSFEITHKLQELLEQRVMKEQLLHKQRVSTSAVIRSALKEYLKGEK